MEELKNLVEKILEMEKFLESKEFADLSDQVRTHAYLQYNAMTLYQYHLAKRYETA